MPITNSIEEIILTSGGGTTNLLTSNGTSLYIITGTATLTSSWTIQPSGTPTIGMTYSFLYKADKEFKIEAVWNGTIWIVSFLADVSEDGSIPFNSLSLGQTEFTTLGTDAMSTGIPDPTISIPFTLTDFLKVRDKQGENTLEILGYFDATIDETNIVGNRITCFNTNIAHAVLFTTGIALVRTDNSTEIYKPVLVDVSANTIDVLIDPTLIGSNTSAVYRFVFDLKIPY